LADGELRSRIAVSRVTAILANIWSLAAGAGRPPARVTSFGRSVTLSCAAANDDLIRSACAALEPSCVTTGPSIAAPRTTAPIAGSADPLSRSGRELARRCPEAIVFLPVVRMTLVNHRRLFVGPGEFIA